MPGTSIVAGTDRLPHRAIEHAYDSICFFDDYDYRIAHRDDHVSLGHSGYDTYPVTRVETDAATGILEGYLYADPDPERRLAQVVDWITTGRLDALAAWHEGCDGEFLVTVHDETTGSVAVLTDAFARLPTYYRDCGDAIVVSRELKFLRELAARFGDGLRPDQLATAQKLLFGYCLGTRTIYADVRRIPPASLATVRGDSIDVQRLYRHELDENRHADRSVEENATRLADRFRTACEHRDVTSRTHVVSLSGGLDSRAVAAAYRAADVPIVTASYDSTDDGSCEEAEVGETVADILDVPWDSYRTETLPENRSRLLDMKQGMNFLGMAYILDFFDYLRESYDVGTYVTGDGGDKVLVDLTPPRSLATRDETVSYVVSANNRIPIEKAAAITDVSPARIEASIEDRLDTYPETDWSQKYAKFLLRERGINGMFNGEDRNRYYFWSVSPFYSLPVFDYAVNCPGEQKHRRRLYREFLRRLAPDLLDVTYVNYDAPVTSLEFRLKRSLYEFLSRYPSLCSRVILALRSYGDRHEKVASDIESQLSGSDVDPLAPTEIVRLLDDSDSYKPADLSYLHTVVAAISEVNRQSPPREARTRPS